MAGKFSFIKNISRRTRIKTGYLCWILIVVVFGYTDIQAQTSWDKYPGNPVLPTGPSGAWDDVQAYYPWVILDSGTYKMWYTGRTGSGAAIGYATSSDGITWTKHSENPVLSPSEAWEGASLLSPTVIKDGGIYKMWYTGTSPGAWDIGYAISTDGITWTKHSGNPVLTRGASGTWDDGHVRSGTVIIESGTFKMWYSGWDETVNRVGYATSSDGITWTKYSGNPVLSGSGDHYQPSVLKLGSDYHLWYTQPGTGSGTHIGYASSTDGITWTMYSGNPVLTEGSSGAWDATEVQRASVFLDGNTFKMWFHGFDGTKIKIGYATSQLPQFTDVGAIAGVNDSGSGSGMAWGDYDGDGDQDFYLANHDNEVNRLYRNNGNETFTEVGASAGVNDGGSGQGVTWGDYDNDGDIDLYLANTHSQANRLYRNNGNGTLTEVGASAGVNDSGNGTGVSWGDYDNDGDIDLYLVNQSQANRLYHNNGDGTFTEVGSSLGVDDTGNGRTGPWGDYDNDGDLDLYLTNDGGTNRLYRNNGDGSFTEVGATEGVTDNGTGVSWADFDNDGDLDLYLGRASGQANRLYRNNANGTFTEVGASAGVNDSGEGIGVAWGDYDNDGDLDLHLANTSGQANRLYQNNGNSTFTEVGTTTGVDDSGNAQGAAWADFDSDGDLDFYLINSLQANRLYRNNGTTNRWLIVKLVGSVSNKDGIGARVTAVAGGTRQRRDVDGGSGYVSQQPSLPVEFGFGSTTTLDALIVRWPSGIVQTPYKCGDQPDSHCD